MPTPFPRFAPLAALFLAAAALALAACGGDDEAPSESGEAAVSAAEAIPEIDAVRANLDKSLAAYRDGDADAAEQLAGDAYLEHFELVEGPLEEVDPELTEELEELIREELRGAILDERSVGEVKSLVEEAESGLDEAEKKLEAAA